MPFNNSLPVWNKSAAKPAQFKIDEGWLVEEKPPASIFNWQWNTAYLALQELQNYALHKDDTTPGDIGAEPAFTKNSAFNKDFGTTTGTVAEGDHVSNTSDPHNAKAQAISWAQSFGLGGYSVSVSDANTITESGFYRNDNTTSSNMPYQSYWDIRHIQNGSNGASQLAIDRSNGLGNFYYRVMGSGTWSAWTQTATQDWVQSFGLGGATRYDSDLNNLHEGGLYYCGGNATNTADGGTGYLLVIGYDSSNGYCSQTFVNHSREMYVRTKQSGTWTTWRKIAMDDEVVRRDGTNAMTGDFYIGDNKVILDHPNSTDIFKFYDAGNQLIIAQSNTGGPDFEFITDGVDYLNSYIKMGGKQVETTTGAQSKADSVQTWAQTEGTIANEKKGIHLPIVDGGSLDNSNSSATGSIKIKLPQLWTDTMMNFVVDVYEYNSNETFTVKIGGYNYSGGSKWNNVTAFIVGASSNRNLPIRFGHDGTNACIWIGDTSETWSYLKVRVRDFVGAHKNYSYNDWKDGWSVSIVGTFDTVQSTKTDTLIPTRGEHEDLKSSVSNGKQQVETAIIDKGGTVSDSDGDGVPTFQELDDGVRSITKAWGESVHAQTIDHIEFYDRGSVLENGNGVMFETVGESSIHRKVFDGAGNQIEYVDLGINIDGYARDNFHANPKGFSLLRGSMFEAYDWDGNLISSMSHQSTNPIAFNHILEHWHTVWSSSIKFYDKSGNLVSSQSSSTSFYEKSWIYLKNFVIGVEDDDSATYVFEWTGSGYNKQVFTSSPTIFLASLMDYAWRV